MVRDGCPRSGPRSRRSAGIEDVGAAATRRVVVWSSRLAHRGGRHRPDVSSCASSAAPALNAYGARAHSSAHRRRQSTSRCSGRCRVVALAVPEMLPSGARASQGGRRDSFRGPRGRRPHIWHPKRVETVQGRLRRGKSPGRPEGHRRTARRMGRLGVRQAGGTAGLRTRGKTLPNGFRQARIARGTQRPGRCATRRKRPHVPLAQAARQRARPSPRGIRRREERPEPQDSGGHQTNGRLAADRAGVHVRIGRPPRA